MKSCAKRGCESQAVKFSNYCSVHRPGGVKNAIVDIDDVWMVSKPHGTVTLPLQVTGSWKLITRIWIGIRLLLLAAWVMNLGVKVDGPESA